MPRLEALRTPALSGMEQALQIHHADDPVQLRLGEASSRIGKPSTGDAARRGR